MRAVAFASLLLTGCTRPFDAEITALNSGPPEARRDAVLALRRTDAPLTDAALEALISATADPDPAVAAGALDAISDQPGPAVDAAVLDVVVDERDRVALTAATTAASRGIAESAVIDLLAERAAAGEIAAIIALGQIGPPAASALPMLTRIATRADATLLRTQAVVAIGKIGPDDETRAALRRLAPGAPGTLRAAIEAAAGPR